MTDPRGAVALTDVLRPVSRPESVAAGTTYRIVVMNYFYQDFGPMALTIAQGAVGLAVTAVSPATGPTTGNTPITIYGSGFSGSPTVSVGGSSATGVSVVSSSLLTAITPAHAAGTVDVSVTGISTSTLSSAFTYVNALLAAPTNLVATASGTTGASLTWTAVTGADHYEVARSSNHAGYSTIASPATNSYTDSGLTASTAYLYEVRAIGPTGLQSAYSNIDVATTIVFTDDPLVKKTTIVKAAHLTELRTAVNALRVSAGLTAYTFTDATLDSTVTVKAIHITELRTALDAARTAAALPAMTYTYTITAPTTLIHATDVAEIRNGVK